MLSTENLPKKAFDVISKFHLEVKLGDNGEYEVLDKSANGTLVNDRKVGKNKTSYINDGDIITLGSTKCFTFIKPEPTGQASYPKDLRKKYIIGKEAGRGACGVVYTAFRKSDGQRVALKVVDKIKLEKQGSTVPTFNEVVLTKKAKHPCIIRLFDAIDTPDNLYLILEFAEGGELFDRIVKDRKFSEAKAKIYFYQIVSAVKHLHSINITHRDLKPENVLCKDDESNVLKISDLGLSKETTFSQPKTFVGTPQYLAPEVLISKVRQGTYTQAADMWSLGVILYIFLSGGQPFVLERGDRKELVKQILDLDYSLEGHAWDEVSAEAKDLIGKLLTKQAARLTATQVLQHPWLMNDEEMLNEAQALMKSQAQYLQEDPESSKLPTFKRPHSEGEEMEIANENLSLNGPRPCKKAK